MVHTLLVIKKHTHHNGHVEIDLFKVTKWSFQCLFKLGIFLLYLQSKNAMFSSNEGLTYIH